MDPARLDEILAEIKDTIINANDRTLCNVCILSNEITHSVDVKLSGVVTSHEREKVMELSGNYMYTLDKLVKSIYPVMVITDEKLDIILKSIKSTITKLDKY